MENVINYYATGLVMVKNLINFQKRTNQIFTQSVVLLRYRFDQLKKKADNRATPIWKFKSSQAWVN